MNINCLPRNTTANRSIPILTGNDDGEVAHSQAMAENGEINPGYSADDTLPTLYVMNESVNDRGHNLRYRNRSNDSIPTGNEGVTTAASPVPTSPDSGVGTDASFYSSPASSPPARSNAQVCAETPVAEPTRRVRAGPLDTSPMAYLEHRWRRRAALFDSTSTSSPKLQHFLPVLVVLVVIAGSVFTVLTLNRSLARGFVAEADGPAANSKYDSIRYGAQKRYDRLVKENPALVDGLKGEDGKILRGKRAAMQFAHDKQQDDNGGAAKTGEGEEKVAKKDSKAKTEEEMLAILYKKLQKELEKDAAGGAEQPREELIKKLGQFGHFASSELEPSSNDAEAEPHDQAVKGTQAEAKREEAPESVEKRSVNAPPRSRNDAFRFRKNDRESPKAASDDEDPFAFRKVVAA